jgi:hypothetical protein
MKKTIAQKARELLEDLAHDNIRPFDADDERYISLFGFDPMHGRSEVTYALYHGFIERDERDTHYVRLTPAGREHLKRKASPQHQGDRPVLPPDGRQRETINRPVEEEGA